MGHTSPVDVNLSRIENHPSRHCPTDVLHLIRRYSVPLLLTIVTMLATIVTWRALVSSEARQASRVVEAESYAARSRLVREVDSMLRGLRALHLYWSNYDQLPVESWPPDAGADIANIDAITLIVWNAPARQQRFVRAAQESSFHRRPDDAEWNQYQDLFPAANTLDRETIIGPLVDSAGEASFEVLIPSARPENGTLLAIVDADKLLRQFLDDDSPGYAITVQWDDALLYRRGEPGANLPESWTREGLIRNSMGAVWRVRHAPTQELASTLRTPANSAMLIAGIAISILVGLLAYETSRANQRAAAARRAEQELFELNRGLEMQIAERTRDLEERSADLVTIADSVAHDLRNPLNSISTNAQLLEQQFVEGLGQDGLSILNQISHCVEGMAEILERLLRLSLVSNVTFVRERLDMQALFTEIFEELAATEPPPAIEFVLHDVPDAKADPTLVPILLMNLLGNALKYTRTRDSRTIECGATTGDDGTRYFIRDNGVGFAPELAERLFKAFERGADNSDADGLGLGLDIAARVTSRHNGRIWADSEPGRGATFYFTLGKDSAIE
jgi:signal transduction histidine kinase